MTISATTQGIKPGVCTSTNRPASPFDGMVIYETDTDKVAVYDSSAWVYKTGTTAPAVAIFNETQASGTNGGTFTSGSYVKRTLNTTVVNQITSCTLTSSVISLPAGTYEVNFSASAFQVGQHQTRLRNTTDSTDIFGSSEFSGAGADYATNRSELQTVFVLTATKNLEVQHRCTTTKASNGLGVDSGFGNNNVYTQITITKVA